jgi:hypothetical protein
VLTYEASDEVLDHLVAIRAQLAWMNECALDLVRRTDNLVERIADIVARADDIDSRLENIEHRLERFERKLH